MEELTREYINQVMYYVRDDMMRIMVRAMKYLPYGIIAVLLVMLIFRSKRATSIFLFLVYMAIVGCITLLSREPGSREGIDFALFSTLGVWDRADAFVVENVLLFIPIGVLLPMIWKRCQNVVLCLIAGGVISIMIEGSQYITKRGFVQLDDIVTNVMGTFIGFLLFMIVKWVYIIIYQLVYLIKKIFIKSK